MPHPELALERRIDAELCGLDAKMCVYADDLHGHVVERGLMMNLNRHPRSRFIFWAVCTPRRKPAKPAWMPN